MPSLSFFRIYFFGRPLPPPPSFVSADFCGEGGYFFQGFLTGVGIFLFPGVNKINVLGFLSLLFFFFPPYRSPFSSSHFSHHICTFYISSPSSSVVFLWLLSFFFFVGRAHAPFSSKCRSPLENIFFCVRGWLMDTFSLSLLDLAFPPLEHLLDQPPPFF